MSRSKLFLILALLIPNLTQAKNIILYDRPLAKVKTTSI